MDATWMEFLRGNGAPEHAAHVYAELDDLAASVAGYLATGFADGDPGLVIATPEHWESFAEHLAGCGWDAERAVRDGLLVLADADTVLASFMSGSHPDPHLFEATVAALLTGIADRFPGRTVRAFGEMVDLLCERGQPGAAAALEDLWNELAQRYRFSLLCGYRQHDGTMPEICRSHTRVLA
jgi:KaiC/GvpD/RAD55 family RecA-like ATPase